jgi:hypothetical protein
MPPARLVPEIVSPYAGAGLITPSMLGGVRLAALVPRHQNAVMSYPPLSASTPRGPSALPRA